jgi:Flp pilus assembly pilin Flp
MWQRIRSRLSTWTALSFVRAESEWRRVAHKLREERGAMTIEYILIIALIAIIIITLFTVLLWPLLKPALQGLIDRIVNAINGGNIS